MSVSEVAVEVAVGVLSGQAKSTSAPFTGISRAMTCIEASTRASSVCGSSSSSSEDTVELDAISFRKPRTQVRNLGGSLAARRGIAPTTLDDLSIDTGASVADGVCSPVLEIRSPQRGTPIALNSTPGYATSRARNLCAPTTGNLSPLADASQRSPAKSRCDASQRTPVGSDGFKPKVSWCAGGDASQRSRDASQRSPMAAGVGSWALEAASWGAAGAAIATAAHGTGATAHCNPPCSGSRLGTEPSNAAGAAVLQSNAYGDASQRGVRNSQTDGADSVMCWYASVGGEVLSCKELAHKLQAAAPEMYED